MRQRVHVASAFLPVYAVTVLSAWQMLRASLALNGGAGKNAGPT